MKWTSYLICTAIAKSRAWILVDRWKLFGLYAWSNQRLREKMKMMHYGLYPWPNRRARRKPWVPPFLGYCGWSFFFSSSLLALGVSIYGVLTRSGTSMKMVRGYPWAWGQNIYRRETECGRCVPLWFRFFIWLIDRSWERRQERGRNDELPFF